MSKWRALSLLAVHLLIAGHIVHWLVAGRTVSPIEPSEAMYTLNQGHLNAGFLFFGLAILATIVLGRFVCGWGCHFIAYQDISAWLLRKVGIRPKPLRSRILVWAPFALALYMFVWPTVYRAWMGVPRPGLSNHLIKSEFWETFPGVVVGVGTVLFAGFAIVYILGSKGFCTHACPYGGFFGLADKVSPGRIRVTDACTHCGHCTSACSSNVRVHEEVAKYGMVVDAGCMKCMDCVSVCPNDALYYGFGRPSIGAGAKSATRPPVYSFTLAEEVFMALIGLGTLLALRGLYGQIPLLLAMALAAMTALLVMKAVHLVQQVNVRFQNWQLKRGGRLTPAGLVTACLAMFWVATVGHSAMIRFSTWRGERLFADLSLKDEIWWAGYSWWDGASPVKRAKAVASLAYLERADRWGLMSWDHILADLIWLNLAIGRDGQAQSVAERYIKSRPEDPDGHRRLASVLWKCGNAGEAEVQYHAALLIDPDFALARRELGRLLRASGRVDEAVVLYRAAPVIDRNAGAWIVEIARSWIESGRFAEARNELTRLLADHPDLAAGHGLLGIAFSRDGNFKEGIEHLRRAVELDPTLAEAQYNLGYAYLVQRQTDEAIEHLAQAVRLGPELAAAHYNLGVAKFVAGRAEEAEAHVRECIRLAPQGAEAHGFLSVIQQELRDPDRAQAAAAQAEHLRGEPK